MVTRKKFRFKEARPIKSAALQPGVYLTAVLGLIGIILFPTAWGKPPDDVVIPYRCATCDGANLSAQQPQDFIYEPATAFTVPADAQYYEVSPGVVSTDGSETFRIYVHLGRAVNRVYMSYVYSTFPVSRTDFRDDGTDGDLVAGDDIYTSGEFSVNYSSLPLKYLPGADPSLSGITYVNAGTLTIEETDTTEDTFLIGPQIGLIEPSVTTAQVAVVTNDIQVATHLVNIRRTGAPAAQTAMHSLSTSGYAALQNMIQTVYGVIPDEYDFIVVMSSMHGEKIPRTASQNFYAGIHYAVQNAIAGIGYSIFDNTASYGSTGRLLSVNLLDTGHRGNYINNTLHEITHQWAAYVDFGLGIKSDGAHWSGYSNMGSILGGFVWIPQPDGSWLIDVDQFRSRLSRMAPIDRYLAGFIPAAEVPLTMVYDTSSTPPYTRYLNGEPILPEEVVTTVTIDDIIAIHGERTPKPLEAQRHFNVLFVVESIDRFLTANEMTFYNRLAREFERVFAPADPTPIIAFNWVPAARYFVSGVTLSSRVTGWDSDGDDLYDDWEMTYFSNLTQTAESDPDHDGLTTFAEQAYLTHPNAADLQTPVRIYQTDTHVTFEYTSFVPTFDYSMDTADALGKPTAWTPAGIPTSTLGPHRRFELPKSDIASGLLPPTKFARGAVMIP